MSDSARLQRPSLRRLRLVGIVALVIALALALTGIAARTLREHALKQKIETDAVPTVAVIVPAPGDSKQELVLPSNIQPWYDAPIYARVSGYLKKWYVDIGAKVKAGEVLAEIETPELDQQLQQARADLATAVAKEKLAETTNQRWQKMLASTSVSKQEADEKSSDFEARKAEVNAQRANVDRLQAMASFKRVVAPFDGTVTERKTDLGALINAGSGSGPELFRVADTHKLRIYVEVPQAYAERITTGMQAQLQFPERHGKSFPASVVSTANAISESSRTLLVQLEADNADGKLIAGSYADVHFDLPAAAGALQLPVTSLIFRQNGLRVATLGKDDKVTMKNVEIGRDYGTKVEIVNGLVPDDRVIDSPPDWLAQGDKVRPAQPEKVATSIAATHAGEGSKQ
ncbi:efflux RND transporter periplasmic adaptor subunit [Rudaea sp.]|uniref:efflux RND transporter periplasmic adaptor subunit n=1 Tax=Rudaea sp. TaxID=2136325 RepID=UPI002ED2E821